MKFISLLYMSLILVSCAQKKLVSDSNLQIDIHEFRDNMPVVPPDPIPEIKTIFSEKVSSDIIPVYYVVGDNKVIIYEIYVILEDCTSKGEVFLEASDNSIFFEFDYKKIREAASGDTLFMTKLRFPIETLRQESILCNKVKVAIKSEFGEHVKSFNYPFEIKNIKHSDLTVYIDF